VREGSLAEAPVVAKAPSERQPAHAETPEPVLPAGTGVLAKIIGWGVVLVPIVLVVGWGLWSGFEESRSEGASVTAALGASAMWLVLGAGGTFAWAWIRRRRR
jgi:hypothetical protein